MYLLADKLAYNEEYDEGAGENIKTPTGFDNDQEDFWDYTDAKSLLFFQPSNSDYATVSNSLPTLLKVPVEGWYIKRSGVANFYTFHSDDSEASEEGSLYGTDSNNVLPNLYNNFWGDEDTDNVRSFMDINGLKGGTGRAYHLGTFSGITAGTFDAGTYESSYSCYKLNSAGTGFALATSSSTVQPFRTFFAINDNGAHANPSSEAKALTLGFCGIADIEDTPTQIDGAPVEGIKLMTTAQSRVYSLDGRYVGQYGQKKLAPGMYIMNGKKFVVK